MKKTIQGKSGEGRKDQGTYRRERRNKVRGIKGDGRSEEKLQDKE